jgi:hypothetical protein
MGEVAPSLFTESQHEKGYSVLVARIKPSCRACKKLMQLARNLPAAFA